MSREEDKGVEIKDDFQEDGAGVCGRSRDKGDG